MEHFTKFTYALIASLSLLGGIYVFIMCFYDEYKSFKKSFITAICMIAVVAIMLTLALDYIGTESIPKH